MVNPETSTDYFFNNSLQLHHDQAFALYNQIEKLKLISYPTTDISSFINELSTICILLLKKFEGTTVTSYPEIKLYRQILNDLREIVSYISQANVNQHPMEVMIPAKEIILKFGDETLFFTQPVWVLNYGIGDVWSKFSTNVIRSFPDLKLDTKKKILIQFPTVHKDDVLLGCVMGHELGHYFDLHSGLNISAMLLPQLLQHENINHLKNHIQLRLKDRTHNGLSPFHEDRLKRNLLIQILGKNYLINWLKEFVADIAGILLYGPASHFSGDSIFTYGSLSEDGGLTDFYSSTHPRTSIRSIVRQRTFNKLGYESIFDEDIKEIIRVSEQKWEKADTNIDNKYIDGIVNNLIIYRFMLNAESYSLIEDILLDSLDAIIDAVFDIIPSKLHYSSTRFNKFVPELSKKISNFIPPNETSSEPADSISILNAGWHAFLIQKEKLSENLSDHEKNYNVRELINNLVKKALTSANIHRRWNDARY